jgi:hypothetical protein
MLFKITRVIVFCSPKLDATSFDNGYSKTEELVCSAINEERVCNSSARAFRTQFHSAGWFNVKLCTKCTLHSCYRRFLRYL